MSRSLNSASVIPPDLVVDRIDAGVGLAVPKDRAAKPKKRARKNRGARWTPKRARARPKAVGTKAEVEIAVPVFGDETHVSIDREHGFVRRFTVTDAAADDRAQLAHVLDPANPAGCDAARRPDRQSCG